MRLGQIVVRGAGDAIVLRRHLRDNIEHFMACYDNHLYRRAGPGGTLRVAVELDSHGRIVSANAAGIDGEFKWCVISVLNELGLPSPRSPGPAHVQVTLHLDSDKGLARTIQPDQRPFNDEIEGTRRMRARLAWQGILARDAIELGWRFVDEYMRARSLPGGSLILADYFHRAGDDRTAFRILSERGSCSLVSGRLSAWGARDQIERIKALRERVYGYPRPCSPLSW